MRPIITVNPTPHIRKDDLLQALSLNEITSLYNTLNKWNCPRPHVTSDGEVYPWDYIRWERYIDETSG